VLAGYEVAVISEHHVSLLLTRHGSRADENERNCRPTITVDRTEFYKRLGKEYSALSPLTEGSEGWLTREGWTGYKEFDELLFEYGLELDEDVRPLSAHLDELSLTLPSETRRQQTRITRPHLLISSRSKSQPTATICYAWKESQER
jgi:hypothetical protein